MNDLYVVGLNYANKVYELYHSEEIVPNSKISVREADIWRPLITIATIIDRESGTSVRKELDEYSVVLNKEKKKINIESNISYKLINILDEFLEQQPKVTKQFDNGETGYWVQRVFEYIKGTGEFEQVKNVQHLSRLLNNNLEIESVRIYDDLGSRLRVYIFDRNTVDDLKKRYNLD